MGRNYRRRVYSDLGNYAMSFLANIQGVQKSMHQEVQTAMQQKVSEICRTLLECDSPIYLSPRAEDSAPATSAALMMEVQLALHAPDECYYIVDFDRPGSDMPHNSARHWELFVSWPINEAKVREHFLLDIDQAIAGAVAELWAQSVPMGILHRAVMRNSEWTRRISEKLLSFLLANAQEMYEKSRVFRTKQALGWLHRFCQTIQSDGDLRGFIDSVQCIAQCLQNPLIRKFFGNEAFMQNLAFLSEHELQELLRLTQTAQVLES